MTDLAIPIRMFVELEKLARLAVRLGDQRTLDVINTRLADVNMKLVVHGKTLFIQTLDHPQSEGVPDHE